jgi:hypothetical protein
MTALRIDSIDQIYYLVMRLVIFLIVIWILSALLGCASVPDVDKCPCASDSRVDFFVDCECFWRFEEGD